MKPLEVPPKSGPSELFRADSFHKLSQESPPTQLPGGSGDFEDFEMDGNVGFTAKSISKGKLLNSQKKISRKQTSTTDIAVSLSLAFNQKCFTIKGDKTKT
jgi:hypothetical protein